MQRRWMDRGDPQIAKTASNAPGDMGALTVLGALWDDDNDMILVQVADNRTKKGNVKISAVVDSGAEANALPANMMQWIPLKPSGASMSGKIFRGAGRDPIPARGERRLAERMRDRTAGSSRKIAQ